MCLVLTAYIALGFRFNELNQCMGVWLDKNDDHDCQDTESNGFWVRLGTSGVSSAFGSHVCRILSLET